MTSANPLVAADESTSGDFVTCGMAWMPATEIDECLERLRGIKKGHGLSESAELHCRVVFAGHARAKSDFHSLGALGVLRFISDCVAQVSGLGVRWFGAWCDRSKYPQSLRLLEGDDFRVTAKHIAGLLFGACALRVEDSLGQDYDLVYDADPTLIDWGLLARTQATHFARISAHTIQNPEYSPFLELADVAAYFLARVKNAETQPNPSRQDQLAAIFNSMTMTTVNLSWRPEG